MALPTAQGHLRAFHKFSSYTRHTKKHLRVTLKKQYTKTKKTFFLILIVVLWVLPFCTIAIKLGHADIIDLSVKLINTSLQKHVKNHQKTYPDIKKDACLNAYSQCQCTKVACYPYHRPTYHPAAKKPNQKQGQYKRACL